jgi:glycosyltransferase involved in cell wall biosynthesis
VTFKILLAGTKIRYLYNKPFIKELNSLGVTAKLIVDREYVVGFPTLRIRDWFSSRKKYSQLIQEFKPDVVVVDHPSYFGLETIKQDIPLVIRLKGDLWSEVESQRNRSDLSLKERLGLYFKDPVFKRNFVNAKIIFPVCDYLEKVVNERLPNKKTKTLHIGIDPKMWYSEEGMKLNHPCVGLLQGAEIWKKTKEILILKDVLKAFPNVTFYWAGDGQYREKIISELGSYENFIWLGKLKHPDEVRKFLTEIDVYALISGLDMSPNTLLEAGLMSKPVICTKVGGIPELMESNKSGFLYKKGNSHSFKEKLNLLILDKNMRMEMGKKGHEFVLNKFQWKRIAKDFIETLELIGIKPN